MATSQQAGTSKQRFDLGKSKDVTTLLDMLEKGEFSDVDDFESDDDMVETLGTDQNVRRIGAEKVGLHDREEEIGEDYVGEMFDIINTSENEIVEEVGANKSFLVTEKKNIKWRKRIEPQIPHFLFENVPSEVVSPLSPISYFEQYVNNEIYAQFAEMTNIYAEQQSTANYKHTTTTEIKIFIGLHILMGNMQLPRIRMYWDKTLKISGFAENMSRNRFFQLRRHLHIVNNLEIPNDNKDKMIKVRPIYNAIRTRCLQLEVEKDICVDEQIVPFKGKHVVKQYIRGKPNPWGIKIFFLCGKSGLAYDFIIYQGGTTELDDQYNKFGQGAAVVLQLTDRIKTSGHSLFCDNYFTSYNLLQILSSKICMLPELRD